MSSEWRLVTIGELADTRQGSLAVGPFGSRMKADLYVASGVRVIRGNNLGSGRQLKGDFVHVTTGTADSLASCCLTPGDLVFPHRGNIGEVGITPDDGHRYMLSTSLMKLSPDRSKVDPLYLLYFFKSITGRAALLMNASQVGTPGIATPLKSLRGIELKLPELGTQLAITAIMQSLDDRISLLRETNATLEAIAQALFKSWFVDFDPVRAKMEGRVPEGMDEATAALFPNALVESELGVIPQGWTVQAVGSLLAPKRGKSITRSKCVEGEIPVVAGGLDPAYFHNRSNVSSPVVTISASGANAGFVRLYQQDIWASDCSFVGSEQTDSIYFWYVFLKTNQEKIYFMQQGAAQPHIYPSDLMRLAICTPVSKELRVAFNSLVSTLFEKIERSDKLATTLTQVRDSLLPRLISGKLRLPEALKEATQ